MIAFLTGRVFAKRPASALIEVGGIGYQLAMSTSSIAALPAEGDEVTVWTHLHVREDELSLFGFESEAEKAAFELLITVSGVGPKVALSALSAMSAETLAQAIATEDDKLIATIPGVGKKTAQRIILDLKDKLGAPDIGSSARGGGPSLAAAEASDALLGMGFSSAEIAIALQGSDKGANTQSLVRHALRRLGAGR